MFRKILSFVFIAGAQAGILGDNLIMKPLEGKEGEEMVLIFINGAYCKQQAYVDHLKAIQEKVPYRLWVAVPHIVGDLPIPPGFGVYISDVKHDLKTNHNVTVDKFIYGGHSLGGASIASWVQSSGEDAWATFLWGSYTPYNIKDPAKNYRSPVLTVGAEYDGWLARITRIAQSYDQMLGSGLDENEAKYRYPVVVIPGLNHASFLASIPPSAVQNTDLRATISIKDAIDNISDAVSSFIIITKEGYDSSNAKDAKQILDHKLEVTGSMVNPIIDMMRLEGNPQMTEFNGGTPWTVKTQELVADISGNDITFVDEQKSFTKIIGDFLSYKPSIRQNGHTTQIHSISHPFYELKAQYLDIADFYAAYEVGSKFISREAIYNELGMDFTGKNEATCRELNEAAYDYVLQNWKGDASVIKRWQEVGQKIEFVDDTHDLTDVLWVNQDLVATNTTTTYQLQSRAISYGIDYWDKNYRGQLYCKLVSPARIIEWILVDSLKMNRYWAPRGDEYMPDAPTKEESPISFLQ